ncbi:hypothetical protein Scep_006612 [Stephania cephalantha]|uniref:Uncharacterized protein n=1 Tax=Stephania cephalantha TaxID=152367 RepID=A0AAP0KB14_9MAGN
MGASHWFPKPNKFQYSNFMVTATIFHEWEMNFNPTLQNQATISSSSSSNHQQHQQQEDEESSLQEPYDQDHQSDQEKARCEWDFNLLCTILSSNQNSSDTLGATEFDPSGHLLATAGIARKIRIYNTTSLLASSTTTTTTHASCDYYICTPAKLSSLKWKPNSNSPTTLGSGDYDGVVTEYDLDRQIPVFERDEHGGRRVWSIDYSSPSTGVSGSDDGTMQVWDTRCTTSGGLVGLAQPSKTKSAVCCVEFSPFDGDMSVGLGCADKRAYMYDVRNFKSPILVLSGHERTVSYVRFLGEKKLVSGGTDGFLKMWDLESGRVIRCYRGHVNRKHFVGLAVTRSGGLIACGSESGEVFVYDERWGEPIWVRGLSTVGDDGEIGMDGGDDERRFVGSVGWRDVGEGECTLVAGGSDGILQVFEGRKKSLASS